MKHCLRKAGSVQNAAMCIMQYARHLKRDQESRGSWRVPRNTDNGGGRVPRANFTHIVRVYS